jgi:hypothetical protein
LRVADEDSSIEVKFAEGQKEVGDYDWSILRISNEKDDEIFLPYFGESDHSWGLQWDKLEEDLFTEVVARHLPKGTSVQFAPNPLRKVAEGQVVTTMDEQSITLHGDRCQIIKMPVMPLKSGESRVLHGCQIRVNEVYEFSASVSASAVSRSIFIWRKSRILMLFVRCFLPRCKGLSF